MERHRRGEEDGADFTGWRSVLGAPLTSWAWPAVVGGLVLFGAAALGVAAIGGWVGIVAVLCLAALLLAVIAAAS